MAVQQARGSQSGWMSELLQYHQASDGFWYNTSMLIDFSRYLIDF